jgi:uncharacterized protein YukE
MFSAACFVLSWSSSLALASGLLKTQGRSVVVVELRQERVNEAAEKFVDTLKESYRVVAEQAISMQELNAGLRQNFLNEVMNNLRTQSEANRHMTQRLGEHNQRALRATQTLAQETAALSTDWLNSAVSYSQRGLDRAEKSVGEGVKGSATRPSEVDDLPLEHYDLLNAAEIIDRIEPLGVEQIRRLRDYEAKHKNRQTVIERLDARINAAAS